MVLFLLFCLAMFHAGLVGVVHAQTIGDTLHQGQFISPSFSVLSSSQKAFSVNLYSTDQMTTYFGIFYNNPNDADNYYHPKNPVWIANRNSPLSVTESYSLYIDSVTGHLNLITDVIGGIPEYPSVTLPPVWVLYNATSGFNRTVTLLDTGNLVLKQGNVTLWQSFDYPTNTLLPGMKLGFDHETNRTWSLTSWVNETEPADGAFTLEWDPWERGLVVKFRGKVYWTSGKLRNNVFQNIVHYVDYKYMNSSDVGNEDYFSYTLDVHEHARLSNQSLPGWILSYNGTIYEHADEKRVIAAVNDCYGYNKTGSASTSVNNISGCELWEQPKCRNVTQKFVAQTGYFSNSTALKFITNNQTFGYSDCKAKCWEDCACFGFKINDEPECIFYRGNTDTKFYNNGDFDKIYILATDFVSSSDLKKRNKGMLMVVLILLVYFILLLSSGVLRNRWRNMKEAEENQIQELLTMDGYTVAVNELGYHSINDIKFFSFKSISAATRNFSSDNKLGEGGFGPVYKGEFHDGKEIAVKILSRKSAQGISELRNELILLAKLQHTNLVRILGCCVHREEKMLLYDYMPNKSLDLFLFDDAKRVQLNWERRFSIIEGIAQGLLYLHKHSRLKIIHRDLKAANILLDQEMNPKISDFGLARIFMQNLSEAYTSRVVGTYGYMAPEYALEGTFSVKSDVYSFGVLILEILSGRKNNSFFHSEAPFNLVAFVWELWKRGAAFDQIMDPSLTVSCIEHQFMRCVHVGLLCVEDRAVDRPTMDDVTSMLANDICADLPLPKRPAYYNGSISGKSEAKLTNSSQNISGNGLSISKMEA